MVRGDPTDGCFQREDTAVVFAINSIAIKTVGNTERILKAYAYGDCVSVRGQLYSLPRAIRKDRAHVGTIVCKKPGEGKSLPAVISLVTQYNFGKPVEENSIAQSMLETSKDYDFKRGLENDTALGRISNFKRAMRALSDFAKDKANEKYAVYAFHCGIGRGGKMDDIWVEEYLPALKMFAEDVIEYGITVLITTAIDFSEIPSQVRDLSASSYKVGMIRGGEI